MSERRNYRTFQEEINRRANKQPEPVKPMELPSQLSPYHNLEVEHVNIKVEFSYKGQHSGAKEFRNLQTLRDYLNTNPNVLEYLRNKK